MLSSRVKLPRSTIVQCSAGKASRRPSPLSKRGTLYLLTLAAMAAVGLGSCASAPTESGSSTSPQAQAPPEGALKVVTTTLPVTDFTKAVAGDRAEVTYLLPTNVGPHDYQAKPEDARTVAEANVLVKNGLGVEEYLDDLVANANNQNLKTIDTSQGVQTISNDEVEGHKHAEGEEHAANEEPAEGKEHAGAEAGAGAHEHEGEFNPHIWLDPARAIQQVENIRDGLIAADPEGKDTYTANAAAYIDKLKALDAEFATALKPYADKEFVTYHDFAPYFAQRYDLKAEYLVGVPEENPAPGDVKRVMNAAQASDLKTLLTEPQVGEGAFSTLSKDLNVQVSTFDPVETSGPEGVQPDYYLTMMRQNVKNLQTAFSGQSAQSQLPVWSPARAFAVGVTQPIGSGLSW